MTDTGPSIKRSPESTPELSLFIPEKTPGRQERRQEPAMESAKEVAVITPPPNVTEVDANSQVTPKKRSGSPVDSGRKAIGRVEGWVQPHNPDDEAVPSLPTYHEAAKRAERAACAANEELQALIGNGPRHDEQLPSLLKMVKSRQRPRYGVSKLRIMVDGEAGKGKSFTLNNVLGCRDLSIQAGGPKGCTNVVTEYHNPTKNQSSPFVAEIFLPTTEHAVETVNKYVSDFIKYSKYLDKKDASSDSEMEDMEDEESQGLQQRSESALLALSSLFCGYPEFRDRDAAEEYLNGVTSLEDPKIRKCHQRIKRIVNQLKGNGDNGSKTVFEAADVSVLRNRIQPFITDTPDSMIPGTDLQCCPWPIVQLIQLKVMARVLKGVIIVDNPGLGDTNTSHVDKARQSLQDADIIMVMGDIERVDANQTIERELKWAYKRRGADGVIMVCTKSDANLSNDVGTKFTAEETRHMASLDDKIAGIGQEISDIGRSRENAFAEHDMTKLKQLDNEEKECQNRKRALENERFETRVLARNRTATTLLREKYKRWTKGAVPSLPIFCVSNTEYDKYLRGYHVNDPPQLSLAATGIPALRRHILSVPAQGRFNALAYLVKQHTTSMLLSLDMFCTVSQAQRKVQITVSCTESRGSAKANVGIQYKRFSDNQLQNVKQAMAAAESSWIREAGVKCDKWANINGRSHATIVKKNGCHITKAIGMQNWNDDLLVPIRHSIDKIFRSLRDESTTELATDVAQGAARVIQKLIQTLEDDPTADIAGVDAAFRDNLEQRKEEIEKECREAGEDLARKFRTIQDYAVTLSLNSYFPPLMTKVYDQAKSATRSGRFSQHKMRCAAFKEALQARNGPFHAIQLKIMRELKKALDDHCVEMTLRVDGVFAEIEDDAGKSCPGKEDNSPEGKEFRQKLKALVAVTRKKFAEEIIPDLEEACRNEAKPEPKEPKSEAN